MPLFLQGVKGTTASNSGLLLAPVMVGVAVSSMIGGRLTSSTGRYKPWVLIGAVGAVRVTVGAVVRTAISRLRGGRLVGWFRTEDALRAMLPERVSVERLQIGDLPGFLLRDESTA